MWEAVTDVLALFKIGGKPLLKKRKRSTAAKPGLTGAALEAKVDQWARNPLYSARVH